MQEINLIVITSSEKQDFKMSEQKEKRIPYQSLSRYPSSPPPLEQPVVFMAAPTGHQAYLFQSTAINGKPMVYSPMMVMAYPSQPQV